MRPTRPRNEDRIPRAVAWLIACMACLVAACGTDDTEPEGAPAGVGGAGGEGGASAAQGGRAGLDPDPSYITDPSDPDDLYRILDRAPAGAVIEVRGTQYVDETFLSKLKDGQALVGDVDPKTGEPVPTLEHHDGSATAVHSTRTQALSGATLENLELANVRFTLQSPKSEPASIHAITFRNLTFRNATTVPDGPILHMGAFIEVLYSNHIVVTRCRLLRESTQYGGRGVTFRFTTNSVVHGTYMGTDRSFSQKWGRFKTGVNLSGHTSDTVRTQNIKVADNFIRRRPVWGEQDGSANGSADHMMYGWGYRGWHITGNRFDGWPADRSGHLKLRGGEETIVYRNRLYGGGFITKAEMAGAGPKLFKRAHLARNFVYMTEPIGPSFTGFLNWRNGEPACSTAYESDIQFVRNVMWGGGGAKATFNGSRPDRSCLSDNYDFSGAAIPAADYSNGSATCAPHLTSGCTDGAWLEQLPGVYAGDFNGDGKEDLAFREGQEWIVHRSFGHKYLIDSALSESGTYAETYDQGAAVGDFDGNGRDDILYPGSCDGAACWRVLAANGEPVTFTPMNFGNAGLSTLGQDSAAYGFIVGHFGTLEPGEEAKQDLAFVGADGLRVNLSDGSSLTSSVWSASLNNSGVETETQMLGIKGGDFDGDGFDDLVFRAKCGPYPAADCWRLLLSDGASAFSANNWGDLGIVTNSNGGLGMTTLSRHFGVFVGDRDADGTSDLAFVSHSSCGWQYLKPNGSGSAFEGTCSPTFDLSKVPE